MYNRNPNQKPRTPTQLMNDNMIVKHYAGSIAYGTNLPTSDVDFRGIFCADQINVRTPFFTVRECEDSLEEDTKLYELAHFMKLCLDCNPNVVETLWVDPDDIVQKSAAYDILYQNRHRLLSSKIAFTTSGYALAQLKRIKGHNKWINNPQPVEPPQPKDFLSVVQWFGESKNLHVDLNDFWNDYRMIPFGGNIYGIYEWSGTTLWNGTTGGLNDIFEDSREGLGVPLMVVKYRKDEYRQSKETHKNYWSWKNNRNAARGTLEEQFGYDTKHAMHLVRLLRMGKEALKTGELIVKRPDAEELLAIRNGTWSYEEVVRYAESMDNEVTKELYNKTNLPKKPDVKFAAQLLMEVQDSIWMKDMIWTQ